MNWNAVSAIGQAVSALALILVFVQVRDAHEEMEIATNRARLEGTRDMFLAQATDGELGDAWSRARVASGIPPGAFFPYLKGLGLSDVDAYRVNAYQLATWNHFQIAIMTRDRLRPCVKAEFENQVRALFHSGIGRKWYELAKQRLNPDAVGYVDSVLARPAP
jgi:hypothetical protein